MHTTLYTESDYAAISAQLRKRWLLLGIPCCILFVVMVVSLCVRVEWLTAVSTFLIGALLIAGYDLFLKPLHCYATHLKNCLHGRTRECELPFINLSENIDLVEGVRYRQLLVSDCDAKGRPYERLFYFDAEKTFPSVKDGDILRIVHHDLTVADVQVLHKAG